MCSRYSITIKERLALDGYEIPVPKDFEPNYNLAPTQLGLVLTADQPAEAQAMHFGLIPFWAKDTKLNISTLNAKSEEAFEKTTWKPLIEQHKRCLVFADGFYEWDRSTGNPLPWRFVVKDRKMFSFAGLWSQWKSKDGQVVYRSFSIMTTEANDMVGKIHEKKRMPVILDKQEESLWLSKDIGPKEVLSLCDTYPDDLMDCYRVSTEMNAAAIKRVPNNKPEFILPMNSQ